MIYDHQDPDFRLEGHGFKHQKTTRNNNACLLLNMGRMTSHCYVIANTVETMSPSPGGMGGILHNTSPVGKLRLIPTVIKLVVV